MDTQLKKWICWLKVVHDDVQQLLINRNIFWDVQEIIKNNPDLHKPSSFYSYLGDTYVAYVSIGIRRQVKVSKQSISFARLLSEIIETPSVLSREYYRGLYKGSVVEDLADQHFDRFSGSGKACISGDMVRADLEELNLAASKVEDFADKRIAHHDKCKPKVLPKFNEVDDCLDALDRLYVKYHLVFHASFMESLMPTYQYDWKEIFEIPWLRREEEVDDIE